MVIRTASGSTARRMSLIVAMRVDGRGACHRVGVRRLWHAPAQSGGSRAAELARSTTSSSTRISPEFILVSCSGTCLASLLVGYMAASFLNSLAAASLSAGWPNRANASIDSRAACHSALSL